MRRIVSEDVWPNPIFGIFLTEVVDEVRVVGIRVGKTYISSYIHDEGLKIDAELQRVVAKPQPHRVVETPGTCAVAEIVSQYVTPILTAARIVAQVVQPSRVHDAKGIVARRAISDIVVTT